MEKILIEYFEELDNAIKILNDTMEKIKIKYPQANLFFNGECNLTINLHTEEVYLDNCKENPKWKNSVIWDNIIDNADCGGY